MFEKKNGKRFLASVMALVMLLSLAPVGALAAGSEGGGGPRFLFHGKNLPKQFKAGLLTTWGIA